MARVLSHRTIQWPPASPKVLAFILSIIEGATEAFQPKKICPKYDDFLFFWGLMGVERGGMHLVWVKSVFWFVNYVVF